MCDELWRSFETFQRIVNKLTMSVKSTQFMHSRQMTLRDMLKDYSMNLGFCQENCTLNRDAYLNMCVLKWENIVGLCCISKSMMNRHHQKNWIEKNSMVFYTFYIGSAWMLIPQLNTYISSSISRVHCWVWSGCYIRRRSANSMEYVCLWCCYSTLI